MTRLRTLIVSPDPAVRNQALDPFCRAASLEQLLAECADLERFRHESTNLYERVRALFFLHAIYRFHLPTKPELAQAGRIPFDGFERLLVRRFDEAIHRFLAEQQQCGPSDALASALAAAYHQLAFQTLA